MRAALYGRVSTTGQTAENQMLQLRAYVVARGWTGTEFIDSGISGAKDKRPALDQLLMAVRRRKVDVVVVWSLDRLGRSLRLGIPRSTLQRCLAQKPAESTL